MCAPFDPRDADAGNPEGGEPAAHGSPSPGHSLRDLLRAAREPAPLAAPARSVDDLLQQVARVERLAADAGDEVGREVGRVAGDGEAQDADLDLLVDLACVGTDVAAGQAAPLSAPVRLAARAAWSAARSAADDPAGAAAARAPVVAAPVQNAVLRAGTLPADAQRPVRRATWAAAALVLLGCGGWAAARGWFTSAEVPTPTDLTRALDAPARESTALVPVGGVPPGSTSADGAPASPTLALERVAPFVEARLWRSLEGRARRGGVGLGLTQRQAPATGPAAAPGSGAGSQAGADAPPAPDVVLAWRPDQGSAQAASLRVHVQGPAGLIVTLPDLGVTAVLGATVRGSGTDGLPAHVDLPLPGGWTEHLARGELRLAFTWPAGPGPSSSADALRASSLAARFQGVSLASYRSGEGS